VYFIDMLSPKVTKNLKMTHVFRSKLTHCTFIPTVL
jgi:hypothetical protein